MRRTPRVDGSRRNAAVLSPEYRIPGRHTPRSWWLDEAGGVSVPGLGPPDGAVRVGAVAPVDALRGVVGGAVGLQLAVAYLGG